MMNNKERLKEFAASIGVSETGAAPLGSRSAFVCLFPYFGGYEKGNLSVYAYSTDYHAVTKAKLGEICRFLKTELSAEEAEGFSDIGPSVDKDLAFRAGLGFYGKNTLMINPRLGSYFFIGYVLTDVFLEPDKPLSMDCGLCGRCVCACPGNALENGFDISRCASAINQKKGVLSEEETEILKRAGYAFGCDICQKVCPHNQDPPPPMEEFTKNRIFNLTEDMLEGLSNREFKEKYGGYAFAWRGKNVLLRNIRLLEQEKRGLC